MASVRTESVSFAANGTTCSGFLARPDDGQQRPGLVVLQEWWGLNDHMKDVTQRFADQGYVAVAPDLFHGALATSMEEAGKLMASLDKEQAVNDIRGAMAHLRDVTTGRIGVVGFCMGGMLTILTATRSADVTAAVSFYGRNPDPITDLGNVTAPLLAFYGEEDQGVKVEQAHALKAEMERRGKWVETHVYPGAGHAFFNDARPEAYNAAAATDSWSRTLAFFAERLGPVPAA